MPSKAAPAVEKKTFRDREHFLKEGNRGALHLERCIENSKLGLLPGKAKNSGRCGVTRSVGMALARCCNASVKGYTGLWATYLSLDSLAHATYFSVDTCRRAIDDLVSTGYLRVVPRRNATNVYILNYERLRREGVEGERADKATKLAAREASRAETDRLLAAMTADLSDTPEFDADEDNFPDDEELGSETETDFMVDASSPTEKNPTLSRERRAQDADGFAEDIEDFIEALEDHFPDHPSITHPMSRKDLARDLQAAFEKAGSLLRFRVLLSIAADEDRPGGREVHQGIQRSAHLANYLTGCTDAWEREFGDEATSTLAALDNPEEYLNADENY